MKISATFEQIQEEIAAMLSIPDDELSDEQRDAMEEYLEELGTMEKGKVDGFGQFIRMQEAYAEAAAEEGKRLSRRAKTAEGRIGFLKEKYIHIMSARGLQKVSGDIYTLSVRQNQSVAVTGLVDELPEMYVRRKTTCDPDKTVIKEALKGGIEIPGCALVTTHSLQIK